MSDEDSGQQCAPPPAEEEVSDALTSAFKDHDVPMDEDSVNVNLDDGLYKVGVRLSRDFRVLPQVPEDTSNLAPGSVEGALYMIIGSVQIVEQEVRVNLRIVSVETSEILQVGSGSGSGNDVKENITGAAGDALAGLTALHAT